MAEDDRKKKRVYPSTRLPNSPQPPIATVGKYEGRSLQGSAEAKAPGEMYGPYRGPFNDPKYHQRGEPVKSIMQMDRFPTPTPGPRRTPFYDSSAPGRSFRQRMDTAAEKVGQAAQDRPQFPMAPITTRQMQTIGDRLRLLTAQSPRSAQEFEAIKTLPQKIQSGLGAIGREMAQGARATRDWAGWLTGNVKDAQRVQEQPPVQAPPALTGPPRPQEAPQKAADMQQRIDAAVGKTPPKSTSKNSQLMPAEALRQLHEKMDAQTPEGSRGKPKVLRHEDGKPIIISEAGYYQLPKYTPTEQEMEAPIQTIYGNQSSYWDPKTEKQFRTLEEAFRGEEAGVTAERAKTAAKREFELKKEAAKQLPFGHIKASEQVNPDQPNIAPAGWVLDKRTGQAVPLGGPAANPMAAAVAQLKSKTDFNAYIKGKSKEEKRAIVNMLTKDQLDAFR